MEIETEKCRDCDWEMHKESMTKTVDGLVCTDCASDYETCTICKQKVHCDDWVSSDKHLVCRPCIDKICDFISNLQPED
jgi:hypothetical protein